ncbi:MAG: 1-deoxy-D-xylulose-5-phosphate reductoisomerase [Acidobacteriota bacterium]|nr:1-deoxy-D-xylulose-5-phosphate reductoisomerase [Acidobacteriota bacterium]
MSALAGEAPGATRGRRLRVAVLGCSGSIGTQTLDVCRQHADRLEVVALSVHGSTDALVAAAREFGAAHACVTDEGHARDAILDELPEGCELTRGDGALADLVALDDVDCVVNALVGVAGMRAGWRALGAGKVLAYANKESIIVAGDILMPLARPGRLIPVDSEHSAIFQCLAGAPTRDVHRIWLTCSGGPFHGMTRAQLAQVTSADALAHPTWLMGAKITIDSATLMNKGFELLEAHHLFAVGIDDIRVLVQRQSRIHSMVEFADGSTLAQLGPSDMRIPIQYALSYPDRWETPCERIDWCHEQPITFGEADEETFGCLALAREAGRVGGTMPCVLNAANEVANAAFRRGACTFLDIERIVSVAIEAHEAQRVRDLEQLEEVDLWARDVARRALADVVS